MPFLDTLPSPNPNPNPNANPTLTLPLILTLALDLVHGVVHEGLALAQRGVQRGDLLEVRLAALARVEARLHRRWLG